MCVSGVCERERESVSVRERERERDSLIKDACVNIDFLML